MSFSKPRRAQNIDIMLVSFGVLYFSIGVILDLGITYFSIAVIPNVREVGPAGIPGLYWLPPAMTAIACLVWRWVRSPGARYHRGYAFAFFLVLLVTGTLHIGAFIHNLEAIGWVTG